jgi:hypothetical protein
MVVFSRYLMDVRRLQDVRVLPEVSDGIGEGLSELDHHEIDGIEILFASKTPAEVCPFVDRRIEIGAEWAEETEIAVANFPGYSEVVDDGGGSDLVSQTAEFFRGDAFSHRLSFTPQRLFRGERFGARVS